MNSSSSTVGVSSLASTDYSVLDALARTSGTVDLGPLPTLVVTGPDRLTWLNGLLTADVLGVKPGRGAWGLLLDRLGKIQAVLGVLDDAERSYLGVFWGDAETVAKELDARLVMEDAELGHVDGAAHWLLTVGAAVERGTSDAAASVAAASGVVTLAGTNQLAVYLGQAPTLAQPTLSPAAWQWLRIQHGLPWGGLDFDERERPHEAALERRAVSWSKGCYLGQEVVCMQDMRGKVKRSVRALVAAASAAPESSERSSDVYQAGKAVGRVTSAVYDPRGGRYCVLAQVPFAALVEGQAAPGTVTSLVWGGAEDGLALFTIGHAPAH